MMTVYDLVLGVLQTCSILAMAPLMTGIMRKVKARTQKRRGSGVLQPYYELSKLFKKDEVASDQSSWIFRYAPWVMLVSTITAALFIPVFLPFSPFSSDGDILVVLGLFALANFFMMLAGLDTASAFGGLGSSREMMMAALIEPALFITIFVISLTLGGTNLTALVSAAASSGFLIAPSMLFALIAFLVIFLAETEHPPLCDSALSESHDCSQERNFCQIQGSTQRNGGYHSVVDLFRHSDWEEQVYDESQEDQLLYRLRPFDHSKSLS